MDGLAMRQLKADSMNGYWRGLLMRCYYKTYPLFKLQMLRKDEQVFFQNESSLPSISNKESST